MTKRVWQQKQRLSPLGDAGVAAMRCIIAEHSAAKVNQVFVDAFSASAFVQVYDAINEKNQSRLRSMCVGEAMGLVWRVVGRSEGTV